MPDTIYRRRFGDRKDGRLIRSLPALNKFAPFVMRTRSDSTNYFSDSIEITEIDRWLRAKQAEGYEDMGMLHVLIAAYVRTIAHRPGLNRFLSGQRVYARHNIEVIMLVKAAMTDEAEETSIKAKFLPTDTIFDVYRKINKEIDIVKANDDSVNSAKFAEAFTRVPRILINGFMLIARFLDYFGWLPRTLLDISPFHGSMMLADLGSLGIPPVFHHLYNFGNLPLSITFGTERNVIELAETGRPVAKKYVDYTVAMDELICEGFYYATSLKFIKYFLRNPAILESPPEKVEQDIF